MEVKKVKTMEDRMIDALRQTWATVCYDVFELNSGDDIAQEEVFNFAYDYVGMYGKDRDAVNVLHSMVPNERDKVLKKAFPAKSYGA